MTRTQPLNWYPEYRDTGCEYSPTCLACPLPACRYDTAQSVPSYERTERAQRLAALVRSGHTIVAAAAQVGVSERTGHRYLEARL